MESHYGDFVLDLRRWWREPPATARVEVVKVTTGTLFAFESAIAATAAPMLHVTGGGLVLIEVLLVLGVFSGAAMLRWGLLFPAFFWQYVGFWGALLCDAYALVVGHYGQASAVLAATTLVFAVNVPFIHTLRWALVTMIFTIGTMTGVLTYLRVPAGQQLLVQGSVAAAAVVACWIARQADAVEEDALTGLCNRRGLHRRLDAMLQTLDRDGGTLALALVDIDHFKSINDTHGHDAGDQVLLDCARAWQPLMYPGTWLGRLGGDEFALLMPHRTAERGAELAEALRSATPAGVTISVGVAGWRAGDILSDLMRRADRALYRAKDAGRARTEVFEDPAAA